MDFEYRIGKTKEGVKITTIGKEEEIYPDIPTASRKIGGQRLWDSLEASLGLSGMALGTLWAGYELIVQRPLNVSNVVIAALSAGVSCFIAIHGVNKENKATAKYEALRKNSQVVTPV